MPKIMEPEVRDAGILQRGLKRSADPLQWPALVGKEMVISQTANLGQSLKGDPHVWRHENVSAHLGLGVLTAKRDEG